MVEIPIRRYLVIRLLLEGVYNNGEVIWLDLRWQVLSLLRSRKFSASYYPDELSWYEVMPDHCLIRYSDFQGAIVWKYEIVNGRYVERFKGWKNSLRCDWMDQLDQSAKFIIELHERLACEQIDHIIND